MGGLESLVQEQSLEWNQKANDPLIKENGQFQGSKIQNGESPAPLVGDAIRH